MSEASVEINGTQLSEGQVMAVRVACSTYCSEMDDPEALGADEHGRRMVKAYRARLAEVLRFMVD